jgi:hypothetical protein
MFTQQKNHDHSVETMLSTLKDPDTTQTNEDLSNPKHSSFENPKISFSDASIVEYM